MRTLRALTYDIVVVFVFAAIGRLAHGEDLSLLGATAWPFVVAAIVGSLVSTWRRGPWWQQGLIAWLITTVIGLLLRVVSGGSVEPAFILTSAGFLALLLIGWRALLRKEL